MHFRILTAILFLNFTIAVDRAAADKVALPMTDFNVITAVDISDSITRHDEWLQYSGLARGVTDPGFLSLIGEGLTRRIGFMVFTWSSNGQSSVIVPWTIIANQQDAAEAAARLRSAPRIDRSRYESNHQGPEATQSDTASSSGGMTDIAQAIGTALRLAASAPFQGRRAVINILSNGVDNAGVGPGPQRDKAIRQGATVNGVVFGPRRDLPAYFERNVIGGPGAFLMTVRDPADLPKALEKKFWRDLIAGNTAVPWAGKLAADARVLRERKEHARRLVYRTQTALKSTQSTMVRRARKRSTSEIQEATRGV
ncbi:DUF1194 domain-containing protein [Pelagibius litoralis]|uniref:DUF1194 domain-containing protein n=1 Tax=Pelagibius litoralis TaxID=374515 RepID=A0A967EYC7_9PROT|nr:DUF1194 domain-containing protein [Pelagibius litoralis]NIA69681.1 DUF1194 domain-containing protein [Pelagibius litoralis]